MTLSNISVKYSDIFFSINGCPSDVVELRTEVVTCHCNDVVLSIPCGHDFTPCVVKMLLNQGCLMPRFVESFLIFHSPDLHLRKCLELWKKRTVARSKFRTKK